MRGRYGASIAPYLSILNRAKITVMRRTIAITGLMILAALLPLMAPPVAIFVVDAPLFVAHATIVITVSFRSVALPALADPRAPPPR